MSAHSCAQNIKPCNPCALDHRGVGYHAQRPTVRLAWCWYRIRFQTFSHNMGGALQVTRTIFLDLVDLIINNSWERWGAQLAPPKRATKCHILSNNAEIVSDRIAIKYNQTIRLSNLPTKMTSMIDFTSILGAHPEVVNTVPMLTRSMELGSTDLRQELRKCGNTPKDPQRVVCVRVTSPRCGLSFNCFNMFQLHHKIHKMHKMHKMHHNKFPAWRFLWSAHDYPSHSHPPSCWVFPSWLLALDLAPCLSFDQEMLICCIKAALKLRKSVIFLQSFWF